MTVNYDLWLYVTWNQLESKSPEGLYSWKLRGFQGRCGDSNGKYIQSGLEDLCGTLQMENINIPILTCVLGAWKYGKNLGDIYRCWETDIVPHFPGELRNCAELTQAPNSEFQNEGKHYFLFSLFNSSKVNQ